MEVERPEPSLVQKTPDLVETPLSESAGEQHEETTASPVMPGKPPDGGYGWIVVLASFTAHVISDGIIYTSGVLLEDIREAFGFSRREMGWLASILIGIIFGSSPINGILVNKYGCRIVAVVGGIICFIGLILSSLSRSVSFLYFSYCFVTACGLGMVFLPSMVIVSQYFEKRRSFAVGLAVCGSGVGTFIFAPLVRFLQDNYGWHGALLIEGAMALNCSLCGALYRPLVPGHCSGTCRKRPRDGATTLNKPEIYEAEDSRDIKEIKIRCDGIADEEGVELKRTPTASLPDLSKSGQNLLQIKAADTAVRCRSDLNLAATFTPKVLMSETLGGMYQEATISQNMLTGSHRLSLRDCSRGKGRGDEEEPSVSIKERSAFRQKLRSLSKIADFSIFRNKAFIIILVGNLPIALSFYTPYVFLPDMAKTQGISEKNAAFLISIIGILSTFGRIFLGWISDKPFVNRFFMFSGAITLMGTVIALFPVHPSFAFLVVNATVYGTCQALCVALSSVVLVDLFGLEGLPTNFGFFMLTGAASFVIGPPIAGMLYDKTGAYRVPFAVMGAAMVCGSLLFWTIPCTREYRESRRRIVMFQNSISQKEKAEK